MLKNLLCLVFASPVLGLLKISKILNNKYALPTVEYSGLLFSFYLSQLLKSVFVLFFFYRVTIIVLYVLFVIIVFIFNTIYNIIDFSYLIITVSKIFEINYHHCCSLMILFLGDLDFSADNE